ncbi:MAG: fluoride efflux transporter FluC [Acidimicrobiales bacterium]
MRHLVDRTVSTGHPGTFPWETLWVSLTGSFIVGVARGLAWYHGLGLQWRAVLADGFCDGLTTWSQGVMGICKALRTGIVRKGSDLHVGRAARGGHGRINSGSPWHRCNGSRHRVSAEPDVGPRRSRRRQPSASS